MDNILVSLHCLTYNHEKFIAEAIESFLMQETNFKFEILIHDDASTDRTAEIIKEYELQYPELIKPIYQSENQYSKGNSANTINHINLNRAKGKYIAVCEGDDYWIDPYKLQKQVDCMEKNPEYSLCVHGGYIVTAAEKKNKATNSMLFAKKYALERPDFLENAPVGDYSYAINLSLLGKVYYIDELMSAYRVGHSGSWTAREINNIENIKKHYTQIEKMLDDLNGYTDYQYTDVITRTKVRTQFHFLLGQRKYSEAKKDKYNNTIWN